MVSKITIGQGYDVHQLKIGLPLIIGGVHIPNNKGVVAHSDGDVLIHAIIDALLGAANMGDIGQMFPNSKKWGKATGLHMLDKTRNALENILGPRFHVINIDSTIILEKPKLSSYIPQMKSNIAEMLPMDEDDLSIKATTTDKLGFIGLEQGIAAQAICLIQWQ